MFRRVYMFMRRARPTWRAWRARRRLVASGVLGRVAEVQRAIVSPSFANVLRKDVTARMKAGRSVSSAQEVADLAIAILRERWKLDTSDVQILVGLDNGRTELDLTAAPSFQAVARAHGAASG